MTPFYFGSEKRRLFGALDSAQGVRRKARAAVICYPWGPEYQYAHRALRHLARLLAASGYDVLRFDYYATGDSAGDDSEVQLAGWRDDIVTAIEELKDSCDARSVSLIGLRVGGALAAEVATSDRKDIDSLVLWDPVVYGPEYLLRIEAEWAKMLRNRSPFAASSQESDRGRKYGLPISGDLAQEINMIDLTKLVQAMPKRTLCISTETMEAHETFKSELACYSHGQIEFEDIVDIRPWLEPGNTTVGALPLGVLNRIVGWMKQ